MTGSEEVRLAKKALVEVEEAIVDRLRADAPIIEPEVEVEVCRALEVGAAKSSDFTDEVLLTAIFVEPEVIAAVSEPMTVKDAAVGKVVILWVLELLVPG